MTKKLSQAALYKKLSWYSYLVIRLIVSQSRSLFILVILALQSFKFYKTQAVCWSEPQLPNKDTYQLHKLIPQRYIHHFDGKIHPELKKKICSKNKLGFRFVAKFIPWQDSNSRQAEVDRKCVNQVHSFVFWQSDKHSALEDQHLYCNCNSLKKNQ